jgi:hypothetical protein
MMTEREKEIYWQGYNDAMVSKKDSSIHVTLAKQKKIEFLTCEYFGVTLQQMQNSDRRRSICYPRQVFIYLLSKKTTMGCVAISKLLQKHHTSILIAVKVITDLLSYNEEVQQDVKRLETRFTQSLDDLIAPAIEEKEEAKEDKVIFFHRPRAEYSNSSPYGIASNY